MLSLSLSLASVCCAPLLLLLSARFESDECKQLRQEIRQARAERENETRVLNDAQQQKAKLDQFHELQKSKRETLKMELRNKLRQKQDLEEKQAYELKIYKQKVKHLLHEQQTGMTSVRLGSEESLALLQDSTRDTEHHSALETRELKVALKGAETSHILFLKHQKIEQEKSIAALRAEYEQKHWELREHYEKKQKVTRDSHEDQRREEVSRLELKKNTHIADLMAKHKRQFDKLKKYYSDITHANLELIKNLKVRLAMHRSIAQGSGIAGGNAAAIQQTQQAAAASSKQQRSANGADSSLHCIAFLTPSRSALRLPSACFCLLAPLCARLLPRCCVADRRRSAT